MCRYSQHAHHVSTVSIRHCWKFSSLFPLHPRPTVKQISQASAVRCDQKPASCSDSVGRQALVPQICGSGSGKCSCIFPALPLSPHAVRFRRETMEPLDVETWIPEWQGGREEIPFPKDSHWMVMVMWARTRLSYDTAKVWGCWRSYAPGETKAISTNPSDHTLFNSRFPVFDSLVVPK